MIKNLSILLPHSDDELFVLPFIKQKIDEGWIVNIFFVTSDFSAIREEESKKMLENFPGVRIFQFGRLNKIEDGQLKNCKDIVQTLLEKNSALQASDLIVTPMFEGGHIDHDEIFHIGLRLSAKLQKTQYCFSLYNAYGTPFVRVSSFHGGPVQGALESVSFSLPEGWSYLKKCFYYRSQFVILTVLFAGFFRTFIIKRRIEMLKVSGFDPLVPHPGRLFYENKWKDRVKSFLRVPIK